MADEKPESPRSSKEKLISLILTGIGVCLLIVGGVGYFAQSPSPENSSAPVSTPAPTPQTAPMPPRAVVLVTVGNLRPEIVAQAEKGSAATPNLSAFLKNSTIFTHAIASSPDEQAALASILTGTVPSKHGLYVKNWWKLPNGRDAASAEFQTLKPGIKTFGAMLPGVLTTASCNYWEVCFVPSVRTGWTRFLYNGPKYYSDKTKMLEGNTDVLLDSFSHQLVEHAKAPRRLHWVHFSDLEFPILANDKDLAAEWKGKGPAPKASQINQKDYFQTLLWSVNSKKASGDTVKSIYRAAVRHWDRGFGRLMNELKAHGEAKFDVILVGTNVESFGEAGGYWGASSDSTSALVRVPLVLKEFNQSQTKHISNVAVSTSSVAPTVLEMFGAVIPPTVQAKSLVPLVLPGMKSGEEPFFAVSEGFFPDLHTFSVYSKNIKIICPQRFDAGMKPTHVRYCNAINLEKDPLEKKDIPWGKGTANEQLYFEKLARLLGESLPEKEDAYASLRR